MEHINRVGTRRRVPDWPRGTKDDVYRVDDRVARTSIITQETSLPLHRRQRFATTPAASRLPMATGLRALNAVPARQRSAVGVGHRPGSAAHTPGRGTIR